MKKVLTVAAVVAALFIGSVFGFYTAVKVAQPEKVQDGYIINFLGFENIYK